MQCCVNGIAACLNALDPSAQTLQPDGNVRCDTVFDAVHPAAHLDNNTQVQSSLQSHTSDAHNFAFEPATHLAATIRFIAVSRAVV